MLVMMVGAGADVRGWHDPITGEPALHAAVRQGAGAATVAALVAAGADPNQAHGVCRVGVGAWRCRGLLGQSRLVPARCAAGCYSCDGSRHVNSSTALPHQRHRPPTPT